MRDGAFGAGRLSASAVAISLISAISSRARSSAFDARGVYPSDEARSAAPTSSGSAFATWISFWTFSSCRCPREFATAPRSRFASGNSALARRLAVIEREWQRIDPKFLDEDEQRYWATIAGRQIRFDQRAEFAKKFAEARASKPALETFLSVCAAENPNRRLRMTALQDRVSMIVERADFDDLVTLVGQAPPWEKDRSAGVRVLLRAVGESKVNAPDQILQRWTWKLAKVTRKVQDRRASAEFPEAKRLLGAVANSRGHRHEENVQKLIQVAKALPLDVGAALLASSEGYTPRASNSLDRAREEIGEIREIATALADNLPAPKAPSRKSRRRKRKKKTGEAQAQPASDSAAQSSAEGSTSDKPKPKRRRRRRKPSAGSGDHRPAAVEPAAAAEPPAAD